MSQPRSSPPHGWSPRTAEAHARIIVDERGVEWEVYDEANWSIGLALEWDYLPQSENPGLIFVSAIDRKRVWPCPANWRDLSDANLAALVTGARSII
jgi:hypothetical protein